MELMLRTRNAGAWVVIGHFFSQTLRLGANLFLTRLLVPEMFGVMTIVTVILGGLAMFSDIGLLQNIVQSKRGDEKKYLNTAWTIQVIRGFLICIVALMLSWGLYLAGQSGWLSTDTVYGDEQLPFILAVVSLTTVISGFNSIYLLLLNRKLLMMKLIGIELFSQMIGIFFMLAWALYKADIWALVFGSILAQLVTMILSHVVDIGGKCRFHWDKLAAYEIIHFGKWVFVSSILWFLLSQGDRLILGGVLSPEILGIYTIAFFLANALKDVILRLVNRVFFPLLSEVVRSELDKVEFIYYRIRSKIDAVTMLAAGFLYSTGSVIISLLYDSRYLEAGWMLEILSLSLVSIGFMLADQLFISHGKVKYGTLLNFSQVVFMYVFVPLSLIYFGLYGAICTIVLNSLLRIVMSLIIMYKKFFLNIYKELMMTPLILVGYFIGEQLKVIFL